MLAVRVEITRYTNDSNPGWVECRLTDAANKHWTFEEKVPIVTDEYLDAKSDYPRAGVIACKLVKRSRDENGREIVSIDTEEPWHVETSDGVTRFDILAEQLTEI